MECIENAVLSRAVGFPRVLRLRKEVLLMNEIEKIHNEISELLSVIDDVWILNVIRKFISGMTKGTKYERDIKET